MDSPFPLHLGALLLEKVAVCGLGFFFFKKGVIHMLPTPQCSCFVAFLKMRSNKGDI